MTPVKRFKGLKTERLTAAAAERLEDFQQTVQKEQGTDGQHQQLDITIKPELHGA